MLNENAVWKPADSCTPLTKEKLQLCTYHQSFQYGTATNAVRAVPVVHYSTRIANQFMGYVNYARHNNRRGPKTYDQHGYPLVRIDTEDEDEQREQSERGRNNNSRYYYVHKVMHIVLFFVFNFETYVRSLTKISFFSIFEVE